MILLQLIYKAIYDSDNLSLHYKNVHTAIFGPNKDAIF